MKRTISASWLRGLCDMFAEEGLDSEALLQACGMTSEDLAQPERRFPATVTARLWELAVAASPNPTLGLDRELCHRFGGLHMVGYAMVACPTLLDGLNMLNRYLAVISEAATFSLQEDADGSWLLLGYAGEKNPPPRQRLEFGMLSLLMACTWLTRTEIRPLVVQFSHPTPDDREPFRTAFLCEVEFEARESRMLLDRDLLQHPLPTQNPDVFAMHEQVLDRHLSQLGHTSIRYRVLMEILRMLKQGEPKRAEIAASLFISDRTLQRRLKEEDSSFQELLNQARQELAQEYLANPKLSLTEIGELLGFADQSNFQRASKRWFGMSLGQYRAQLK